MIKDLKYFGRENPEPRKETDQVKPKPKSCNKRTLRAKEFIKKVKKRF
jgi:hypothetical protein